MGELDDRIKSKREAGGGGNYRTALVNWRGLLEGIEPKKRGGKYAKEDDLDITWRWSNLRDIVADPAYPYTTAEWDIKHSDKEGSGYAMLEDSIAKALNLPLDQVSLASIVGCDCLMEKFLHVYNQQGDDGRPVQGFVYRCIEATRVSGAGGATLSSVAAPAKAPFDAALELLEGRTRTEVMGAAPTNAGVKGDGDLINAILGGTFFADPRVAAVYTEGADGKFVKK